MPLRPEVGDQQYNANLELARNNPYLVYLYAQYQGTYYKNVLNHPSDREALPNAVAARPLQDDRLAAVEEYCRRLGLLLEQYELINRELADKVIALCRMPPVASAPTNSDCIIKE